MPIDPVASVPRQPITTARAAQNQDSRKVAPAEPADQSKLHVRKAETGSRFIYEFRDPETGKMLRQFPSDASLALGALYDRLF